MSTKVTQLCCFKNACFFSFPRHRLLHIDCRWPIIMDDKIQFYLVRIEGMTCFQSIISILIAINHYSTFLNCVSSQSKNVDKIIKSPRLFRNPKMQRKKTRKTTFFRFCLHFLCLFFWRAGKTCNHMTALALICSTLILCYVPRTDVLFWYGTTLWDDRRNTFYPNSKR